MRSEKMCNDAQDLTVEIKRKKGYYQNRIPLPRLL